MSHSILMCNTLFISLFIYLYEVTNNIDVFHPPQWLNLTGMKSTPTIN